MAAFVEVPLAAIPELDPVEAIFHVVCVLRIGEGLTHRLGVDTSSHDQLIMIDDRRSAFGTLVLDVMLDDASRQRVLVGAAIGQGPEKRSRILKHGCRYVCAGQRDNIRGQSVRVGRCSVLEAAAEFHGCDAQFKYE